MHKYKVAFLIKLPTIKFESRYHVSQLGVMPTPKGSYVHFEDAGVVLDFTQIKEMEIDGVSYKIDSYPV